jgi:class 3 adenylate cyclase
LAYSIADEQDDIALKADACRVLAEYNDSKSSFERSVQYYKEYLQLLKEQQRNESKATAEQFQLESTLAALEKKSLLEQATLKATNDLLFKVVPEPVAKRLISGESPIADYIPSLSVIFTDMVGFTSIAKSKEPSILVSELNETFSQIDRLAKEYSIEKIKTIGDAYMAVSFDIPNEEHHSCRIIRFALAIIDSVKTSFQFRVGIHSGPVVAGVIGLERFSYDLWGDTVNVAQRLEATSETSTVHISEQTYLLVKDTFECKFVGKTSLKGIGLVNTYHVIREKVAELA